MAGEVTLLLQAAVEGDHAAVDRLFRLVEADLRAIAGRRRRSAPSGLDADTTLLVNEAFMRLVVQPGEGAAPADRKMFFRFAATKIHNLLIEIVRKESAVKRGGGVGKTDVNPDQIGRTFACDSDILVDLDGALDRFEQFAPNDALVFRVRYFLGCTFEEVAEVVGTSATEAKRAYGRAQLWLRRELRGYANDS